MSVVDSSLLPLVVSVVGGAFIGVVASAVWRRWHSSRRSLLKVGKRKTKTPAGNSGKFNKKLMRLYHTRTYRSARVTWLIAELGVEEDFDIVSYDPYSASDDDRAWYKREIHPHGTVPALIVLDHPVGKSGGTPRVALESGAICLYLAERYGQLLPVDSNSIFDYYDWSVYAVSSVDPSLTVLEDSVGFETGDKLADTDESVKRALATVDAFVRRLNRHLANRSYICGEEFTVADIIVSYCVMWISVIKGGRLMFDYENVKTYLKRLKARPAFTEAMGTPREWITASPNHQS